MEDHRKQHLLHRTLPLIPLILLVLLILLPFNPGFWTVPRRDSGVFQFIGWQMTEGAVPYRDVWDHKPPLIFFINWLGLMLDGGSPWGVWGIELASLCIAAWIGYRLLCDAFGQGTAILSSVAWLLGLIPMIDGGNYPEEFALPFQLGAMWCFWRWQQQRRLRYLMGIGASGIAAFLLKQSMVGVWVGIALIMLWGAFRRWPPDSGSRLAVSLGAVASGALLVTLPLLLYFSLNRALVDFWDAAFRYNTAYAVATWEARFQSIRFGWSRMFLSPMGVMAAGGAICAVRAVNLGRGTEEVRRLMGVALIALPLDVFFTALSGLSFEHYYITWLPSAAILGGGLTTLLDGRRWLWRAAAYPLIALLGVGSVVNGLALLALMGSDQDLFSEQEAIVEFIVQEVSPAETVLLWGGETTYHLLSRRASPTRYAYQYALFTEGYTTPELVDEFLAALEDHPPALIIDAGIGNPFMPSLPVARAMPGFERLDALIRASYESEGTLDPYGWEVYKRRK